MKKIVFWLIVLSILSFNILFKTETKTASANPDYICSKTVYNYPCELTERTCSTSLLTWTRLKANCRLYWWFNFWSIFIAPYYSCKSWRTLRIGSYTIELYDAATKENATESYTYPDTEDCCTPWDKVNHTRTCYWKEVSQLSYEHVRTTCESGYSVNYSKWIWSSDKASWRQTNDYVSGKRGCTVPQSDYVSPIWIHTP